jgi:branched-subunit amino acid aminotransferase/4-amino-4-deoxychorismate lyase
MHLALFFPLLVLQHHAASRRSLTRSRTGKTVESLSSLSSTSAVVVTDYGAGRGSSDQTILDPRPTNITSPRHWLESLPDGAYTVVRCDRVWGSGEKKKNGLLLFDDWIIWGEEFHCNRLSESYQSIFGQPPHEVHEQEQCARPALERRAQSILRQLLNYSTTVWGMESSMMGQVYVATLLAYPAAPSSSSSSASAPPILQGHISLGPLISHPLTPLVRNGIKVAIIDLKEKTHLPNRWTASHNNNNNPAAAKHSAWCRQRRAIEAVVVAAAPAAEPYDEVIMADGDYLLEGLTSNFFVVVVDETSGTTMMMQTAPTDQILNGYIRHCLVTHLYPDETKVQAPTLDEGRRHSDCWQSVFITSSIRLVVPVSCVVAFDETCGSNVVVWEQRPVDVVETDTTAAPSMTTENLYKSLVLDQYTRAGYKHLCA